MENEQTLLKPAEELSRRGFLSWIVVAWSAFTSAMVLATLSTIRFAFPNVLFEPVMIFKAGKIDDYISGEVDERWKERFGVWIVKTDTELYALSTVCTHLGCTPNWLAAESKFKCPCHGSGFHKTGINFEGPAPRPLERFRVELTLEGQILIDKTKKFQQEKGEWNQSESKIVLTG